jgi:bifunctional non-homologous end joining protein LigD
MAKPRGVAAAPTARSAFPEWIEPMAATLTQDRFTGADWLFERKFDGIRLVAFKQGADVRLYSRTRNLQHLPAFAAAIAALPVHDVILDGEMTWDGHTAYHVFDVVWLDGRDVARLTLMERRALLETLPLTAPLVRVRELHDAEPWERARIEGWEGVIAKRRDSPYEYRRSKHWLKMKCETVHDFVIGGFTDPQGGRVGLGAILVGYYEGDDFVFAGKVGTGFDTKLLTSLRATLDSSERATAPFTKAKGLPRLGAHWVQPTIVVRVAFIEWTVHTKLRHARLLGLRPERHARDVVRAAPGRS